MAASTKLHTTTYYYSKTGISLHKQQAYVHIHALHTIFVEGGKEGGEKKEDIEGGREEGGRKGGGQEEGKQIGKQNQRYGTERTSLFTQSTQTSQDYRYICKSLTQYWAMAKSSGKLHMTCYAERDLQSSKERGE